MTRVVVVPQTLDDDAVDALLAEAADAGDEKLLFDARHVRFADPFGMLGLLALGTYLRETGGRPMLQLPQSPDVLRYLGGMGFISSAGAAFEVGDAPRARAAGESNVLLPIHQIEDVTEDEDEEENGGHPDSQNALWIYEPEPEEILRRLVTDYVEISIYRAMLESTASEHGARMTAMRSASENASELIEDYTLEMNRQRQAEITQEIMEVVAGAEGLR